MSVLERGGNAFDAAVAAGFVMQIVEPHLSGPGGDLSAVLWSVDDGGPSVVCGQGVSPAAASIPYFQSLGLDLVPGSGPLAATGPGSFGAWTLLLQRWGTWEQGDVLSYAIGYAENGFPRARWDERGDRGRYGPVHRPLASVRGGMARGWGRSTGRLLLDDESSGADLSPPPE